MLLVGSGILLTIDHRPKIVCNLSAMNSYLAEHYKLDSDDINVLYDQGELTLGSKLLEVSTIKYEFNLGD